MSTDTPTQPLAQRLREIACELQYHPSQHWGAETVGPINQAADMLAASTQPTAAHDQAAINELVAQELGRIANEPPINGNDLAHARVLLAARGLRGASAAPTQAAPDHVPVSAEESAAIDVKLGLVLLPPIRVPERTHALLARIAEQRGLVIQAVVRELLEPSETTAAPVAELVEALNNLLEAVESMQGTYGRVRGDTPEDADTFTHDEWAEKFLQERANEAVAALSRAPGAGMLNV